jgi:hypothetical protein
MKTVYGEDCALLKTVVVTGNIKLTVFWDVKSIMHSEFMPSHITINSIEHSKTRGKLKA